MSTLTYLFKVEIERRDSVGSVKTITPGDVGFMTSGHGVTHTERKSKAKRNCDSFDMHCYQIWVALTKDKEDMESNFQFYGKSEIPSWSENNLDIKLAAENAFGKSAPLLGYFYLVANHLTVNIFCCGISSLAIKLSQKKLLSAG